MNRVINALAMVPLFGGNGSPIPPPENDHFQFANYATFQFANAEIFDFFETPILNFVSGNDFLFLNGDEFLTIG